MEHSAGLAIIFDGKILLVHPKNARWFSSYSIPKGHVEKSESALDAAIRETREEVGILVQKSLIKNAPIDLFYVNKKTQEPWKKITCFMVYIDSLADIGLYSEVIPKSQLQLEEVDWAGFVSFAEAKKKMLPAMLQLID